MADQASYAGKCFCGAVEITASGEPVAMGYCHCSSCRQWSAGPVNAFTLWPPQSVRVTKGGEHVEGYQKTDTSVRKFCELCGGHLYTEHPLWGVTDVYAAIIPSLRYQPSLHVNYAETVLPLKDGLPKYKDMPAEMGGSGDLLPE
ncbi:aldehyde-activating protein [Rhizobium sp. Root1203]|uniref:GFA family protein n=1 Tax=Rhizobium sp. Root1203 TaxID=1736427 RepID=UPI00070A92E3|nr:GFA family protein [Rhizobium sp. Root1203]KQV10426.1 aldehyde-activating protein [Rhizobium sp. Root1203]